MKLRNLKIGFKLITAFVLVGLVPLAVVGLLALNISSTGFEDQKYQQLDAVAKIKKTQVEGLLRRIRTDIVALGNSEFVFEAFEALRQYHVKMETPPDGRYDISTDEYAEIWKKHGKPLADFANSYGYDELLYRTRFPGHKFVSCGCLE